MADVPIGLIVTCAAAVAFAVLAALSRRLLRSVVAYALTSVVVAGAFFLVGSPFAAALELTVGAGLVAVLFLVALTLAGADPTEAGP